MAVKEKGMPFTELMVRAIDNGSKTMTRRVVKPQPDDRGLRTLSVPFEDWHGNEIKCPFPVGTKIYVRETYGAGNMPGIVDKRYFYKAIGSGTDHAGWKGLYDFKWIAGRFMPRIAARLFLEVTSVRVERLQDITQEGAKAEGVFQSPHRCEHWENPLHQTSDCYRCTFRNLWNKINGPLGFQWDLNPWVWVYEFKIVQQ